MQDRSYTIKAAIVGYGGQFNMGKHHALEMQQAGIDIVAVCDVDPNRAEAARTDFPNAEIYTDFEQCLTHSDANLVTLIVPHHLHAIMALQVLNSGRHCILEKPMCISASDADELVRKSRETGLMLSVYHNRRWNDWYVTLQDLVERNILGEIFYIDCLFGGFGHPGHWWRSDKEMSGGAFYDWGAHYMDWMLGILPGRMKSVRGYVQKKLWMDVTNEDHIDAMIEFENGALMHAQTSSINRAGRNERRILGTKAAVTMKDGDRYLTLHQYVDGMKQETHIPFLQGNPLAYYQNIANHLKIDEPLVVTPEQSRRVIALIDTIGESARLGKELAIPFEYEGQEGQ